MGFQYSAKYRIFHCSIRLNMNTNSCWTEKENENSVLHIVQSALVASSSHTAKYFHSRLCRLSIIHNNYGSIIIRAVTQYYSTRTDWWSADYGIHQGMALLPSASCLHGSHAVEAVARRGRGISWHPSHGMPSTLQWGYCSLVCDDNDVTWSDRRPDYVAWFRNLMPSLWARHAAGMGYTLQYYSQDNSRASTDRGSLTRYMCDCAAVLLTARSKHFEPRDLRLWPRWQSVVNYSYSANFWLH